MAGAVGSSSIAGIAARVNKSLRVRAVTRSGGISQHDGSQANCGEVIRDKMKGKECSGKRKSNEEFRTRREGKDLRLSC